METSNSRGSRMIELTINYTETSKELPSFEDFIKGVFEDV